MFRLFVRFTIKPTRAKRLFRIAHLFRNNGRIVPDGGGAKASNQLKLSGISSADRSSIVFESAAKPRTFLNDRSREFMSDFKVGDRVRILPGVATPFVGLDGTICEIRPHDQSIETMTQHFVVFS